MDNIGQYKKVLDLHWYTCGFRAMYIVDIFKYAAVDESTGDIFVEATTSNELDDVVYLEYGNGPGYVGG